MKMRRMRNLWALPVQGVLLLSAACAIPAMAQSTTGSIYGTVADTTGGLIPNASVTVKNQQNGFTDMVQSGAAGEYVFPALQPGNYVVSAKAGGFKTMTQTGIVLDANQNVHVIFNMPAGGTNETVTVTAATTLVDTVGSTLGSTIDQRRIEELPLNGRDAYDLAPLSPGISAYSEGQNGSGGLIGDVAGVTFSTNGLPIYNNSYYLDGASDASQFRPGGNIAPNPDALLEFRILTTNADSEFGAMPGAVVNMVTRSGTNNFHGTLYDFVRNTIFNSKTEFVSGSATHLRFNQFGGNVGGPVLHNRLFGFFSYQGLREATNSTITAGSATVPTGPNGTGAGDTVGASPGGERNGDFSTDKVIPKCGATTYPCPGSPGNPNTTPGIIPAAYLDPVALKVLKVFPIPATFNGSSGGPSPQQTANAPVTANQYMGRVDYQLNSKHRLSYTYFHEFGNQASPTSGGQVILGYAGDLIQDSQDNDIGNDTWTISANKLNTIRFAYSGNHYAAADLFAGQNTAAQLGITAPPGGTPSTQPNFRITGYIGTGLGNSGSAPNIYTFTTFSLGDTFYWTRGKHTLKFGASDAKDKYQPNLVAQRAGIYTVSGFATGNSLADFLLGKSASFTQNNGTYLPENIHFFDPAMFAQDDWKFLPRLTVNLGIRWEVFPPYHGEHNTGEFIPNVQSVVIPSAPIGLVFNGDPGVPDGLKKTSYTRFSPRLGFAYDVFGDGKMAVRGGFGLYYSQLGSEIGGLTSSLYGVSASITNATSFVNPYTGSPTPVSPFPFTPNLANPPFVTGATYSAIGPGYISTDPYVLEYNLTIEREFGAAWSGAISYVANGSRHFYGLRDENAPVYNSNCTATTCGTAATELSRRPYKPTATTYVFNTIDEYVPEIGSSYNSLQAVLTKRFTHGFSINANYVWSKNLSVSQDPTKNGATIENTNSYNFNADYGKTIYDVTQRVVASYLWVSPELHIWGYFGKELLSGWKVSGVTTIRTGTPINITSGADTNYDGVTTTDRPNQIGNPIKGHQSRAANVSKFFNTTAFASVPVGTATGLGTTQFDVMRGPASVDTDLAAAKSIAIWREHKMEFRADAVNAFNNVNLGNPATAFNNAATFGTITSAGSGRILQLSLKYSF